MPNDTPLQRLARLCLNADPVSWVRAARNNGRSWQDIADELHERTGQPISRETVRLWTVADVADDAA